MKNQNKAYLLAILTVLLWSTVATAFKIALKEFDFINFVCFSSLTATIALFVIIIVSGKFSELKSISLKSLSKSALLGLMNPFAYYLILFKAYDILPAQEAQPLNYIWPIMLVLISIPILKQKINGLSFVAILISFFGVLIISTHGNILGMKFSNPKGAALAIGSSIIWAFFWILNMKDKRDETIKLFLSFAFGFVFSLIFCFVFSKPSFHFTGSGLAVIYSGLFEMGISFLVWSKALKYSGTTAKVSNLIFAAPFISLIFIHFILGEKILLSSFIGLVFIVLGIILQAKGQSKIKT
ncbi:MAG: DMT family transporter [Bacteroidales bacterium]|nr:DMT family transporter [Bacteroidales bacterium]